MAILAAAVIPPVAIGLGVVATVCGVVSGIVLVIRKKNIIKTKRHYDILTITDKTISDISQVVSTAIDDNNITDDELQTVTDIYNLYRENLTLLRNNSIKKERNVNLNK